MARKRYLLFYQYKSVLKSVWALLSLILLGVVLAFSSQVLMVKPIKAASPVTTVQIDTENLLQKGLNFYTLEQYQAAIDSWKKALEIYQNQNQVIQQALALNYLSLGYQKTGQWQAAQQEITSAFQLLQTDANPSIGARLYNTQGHLQLGIGKPEAALNSWRIAENFYTKVKDKNGEIGVLINQAQALQTLGLYQRSFKTLQEIKAQLETTSDLSLKTKGLRSLGNAYRRLGKFDESLNTLQESLQIAREKADISAALLSLGNTEFALGNSQLPPPTQFLEKNPWESSCERSKAIQDEEVRATTESYYQAALNYYQKAADHSSSIQAELEAKVNSITVAIAAHQKVADSELQNIQQQFKQLIPSRSNLYTQIHFARSLACSQSVPTQNSVELLERTVQSARVLGDKHTESYALGNLGSFYELNQEWDKAARVTEEALAIAQSLFADDISYQWNWQLGRILTQAPGSQENAIAFYAAAYHNLQRLRNDLVSLNPNVQFTFRESVEPVYRKYVDLLLPTNTSEVSQETLETARNVIESLQLAEINNFFREACLDTQEVKIDQIDPHAAAIYPIILPQRLAVIFSYPERQSNSDNKLHYSYYSNSVAQQEVEKVINDLRQSLKLEGASRQVEELSGNLYQWLIKPFESNLTQVKTLVCVLDGVLRNIPMGVLYNRQEQQYLIEKYAIATAPGLNLVNPQPLPKQLKILLAGLSEERTVKGISFPQLPYVREEIKALQSLLPNQLLFDNQPLFNISNLQKAIQSDNFSIVHLATHGQFSSDPEKTFIVTWEEPPIDIANLDNLLRNRKNSNPNQAIELLVLSACETAEGDSRAALGLAGVSVRAGARSTLATLWQVNDESTATLIKEFYQQLINNPQISKAEALQIAQKKLWEFRDKEWNLPYYWAAYVLVGNWL